MSDNRIRLMGLIGANIGYSKSPLIHNYAAKQLGISASYLTLDLPPRRVADFLDIAWDLDAIGFNVTQPHKRLVAELVDCDLRSVNTLVRGKDGWLGRSTDIIGLTHALRQLNCELKAFKKIVVFGGGGVCLALLDYIGRNFDQGPEVVICRRSSHRDGELKSVVSDRFELRFKDLTVGNAAKELNGRSGDTLWLQASSAPLHGNDLSEYVSIVPAFEGVFLDMVYGTPSRIYDAAASRRLLCQDGLPMLIEQARAAQRLWWEKCCDYDELEAILS